MSKQTLLITLGCSLTEGMGCYDFTEFPRDSTVYSPNILKPQREYQFNEFHKKGWPNKLGKLLGYDMVLNLGYGGASPSFNLKLFMEKYRNESFSQYDVFILWWLPQSHRFSFYKDHRLCTLIPDTEGSNDINTIFANDYLKFIDDYPTDSILETKFYLELMEDYCKLKGYNFLWVSQDDQYLKETNSSSWMGLIMDDIMHFPTYKLSITCGHPNELGYSDIANSFYNILQTKHKHLLPRTPSRNMKWEWNGKPRENTSFNKI